MIFDFRVREKAQRVEEALRHRQGEAEEKVRRLEDALQNMSADELALRDQCGKQERQLLTLTKEFATYRLQVEQTWRKVCRVC